MISLRGVFYGSFLGVLALIAVVVALTSCGSNWIVPEGSVGDSNQVPDENVLPPLVEDETNLPNDNSCDGGEPLPEVDSETVFDAGVSTDADAGTPFTVDGGNNDSDGGSDACRWLDKKNHKKECCKPGHGWGDKNHCHIHWKDL